MTPWDIADQLRAATTPKQKDTILAAVHPDNMAFWIGAHYAVHPYIDFAIEVTDPPKYGPGLAPQAMDKFMQAAIAGKLLAGDISVAISALSETCTEPEWTNWYRPLIEGHLILNVAPSAFNRHAPRALVVPEFRAAPAQPIRSSDDLPARFYLEPVYGERRYWAVTGGRARQMTMGGLRIASEGAPFDDPKFNGVVFEGYISGGTIILTDALAAEHFRTQSQTPSLRQRRNVLENMMGTALKGVAGIELAQAELIGPADLEETFAVMLQQGFDSARIRHTDASFAFAASRANLLVRPDTEHVLTLVEVEDGAEDGKYSGIAHTLIGEGEYFGNKVRGRVFLGLNRTDRRIASSHKADRIGTSFVVKSCGVTPDGSLLYPVFKSWSPENDTSADQRGTGHDQGGP